MEWLNEQANKLKNAVAGPPIDPNTGQPVMNLPQEEKKPWWKVWGGKKKPKKTKKPKKPKKQTKYKRN
jgi:hypothetical protein